jgi:hypothetical protein
MGQGPYCDHMCAQCQRGFHCYDRSDLGAVRSHSRGCHGWCDSKKRSRRAQVDAILAEASKRRIERDKR